MGDSDIGAVEEFTLMPAEPSAPRIRFILNGRGDYQFDTDIDNAGSFSVARALAGLGMRFSLTEHLDLAVGGVYDFARYDFDSAAAFGGGAPWEDIHTGRFLADLSYTLDEHWSVFGGGFAAIAAESGADASDSWTGGGFIGGGYRWSDRLVIRLGVSATTELEDDVSVLPILVVDWDIADHWQLRAGALDTGVSDTFGLGVTYQFDEQWSLGARLGFHRQRFRLDDSGFAPGGVGQDQRVNATFLLTWRPMPTLDISLLGGVAFSGELRVEDDNGNQLFKDDYDPAPFVGARLAWRF